MIFLTSRHARTGFFEYLYRRVLCFFPQSPQDAEGALCSQIEVTDGTTGAQVTDGLQGRRQAVLRQIE
jgi:hypothetical protein